MRLVRCTLIVTLLAALLAAPAAAGSLDIPVRGAGLSFGNSTEFSGLRFNVRDRDLERIDGLTVSLWAPQDDPGGRIRGLSIGPAGTGASHGAGLTINGGYSVFEESYDGISVNGLAWASERITSPAWWSRASASAATT